jgi:SWI/SNF-related matrix-associated actin-dependent regulator 1 of chromatin subfamily A
MLNIGMTKLQLDDAVGGEEITLDGEGGSKDDKTAKEVRKSLLTKLRTKFEAGDANRPDSILEEPTYKDEEDSSDDKAGVGATPVKVARAAGLKEEA